MRAHVVCLIGALAAGAISTAQSPEPAHPEPEHEDLSIRHFRPAHRASQGAFERALLAAADPKGLAQTHDALASRPHIAGSEGDKQVVDWIANEFESIGLEVEVHPFWAYLSSPVKAELALVSPLAMELPTSEAPLPEDPYSDHPELTMGWNGYAGSGDVTAAVVYANYGRKEDFERLAELGVEVEGKIVLARYGGNFRGYKAHFAQKAGAAGLIIYTDPRDSGFMQGPMYPEGGWANPTSIQRGSLKTLPYSGDPLTPFVEATEDAERLDPDDVELPRIPVQPVGWAAAQEILSRMTGPPVPGGADGRWQGGLPFTYRLSGGDDLRVRLSVEQERSIVKSHNVVGTLKGAVSPKQRIIVGSHHDAWGFGAADPLAGTIVTIETARAFAKLAREGRPPARTLQFAAWGAEEFGIIGSTEWVEANRRDLEDEAVAYLNLDGSAMGPYFSASAAPLLKSVILDAAAAVVMPRTGDAEPISVLETWRLRSRSQDGPRFGNLGGGSDHIGFYCHAGIASAGFSGGGAAGTAYHSVFDNLAWYRRVVGDDYTPALMLTRVVSVTAARLANADVLPLDFTRYAPDAREHLRTAARRAEELGIAFDPAPIDEAARTFGERSRAVQALALAAIESGELGDETALMLNFLLLVTERLWVREKGLAERPWFRNMFASNDADSGYAAWMLPALREAIERKDGALLADAERAYLQIFHVLNQMMDAMEAFLEDESETGGA